MVRMVHHKTFDECWGQATTGEAGFITTWLLLYSCVAFTAQTINTIITRTRSNHRKPELLFVVVVVVVVAAAAAAIVISIGVMMVYSILV
jgi:hypothetical protein